MASICLTRVALEVNAQSSLNPHFTFQLLFSLPKIIITHLCSIFNPTPNNTDASVMERKQQQTER